MARVDISIRADLRLEPLDVYLLPTNAFKPHRRTACTFLNFDKNDSLPRSKSPAVLPVTWNRDVPSTFPAIFNH